MLLLSRMVYPSAVALFPAALIFKPPDPDPNTSVSETWVPCDSGQEVGWERQGEWLLCSRLIRFHRTPPSDQSVGLYTQTRACMCVFLCGFYCMGRVRASVVCLGQRTQKSIAGSEGNVSLSAESIHSHQTGSLSIMAELREHTLSFSSLYVSLPMLAKCVMDSITIARVRALGTESEGDVGKQKG